MPVERCVCRQITFRELKEIAQRDRLDLEALCKRTGCGAPPGCTMCRPYIQVMLATGRTELPVMTEQEALRTIAQANKPSP